MLQRTVMVMLEPPVILSKFWRSSQLLQRMVTVLVGLPVVLIASWSGAPWLTILVLIIAVQGTRESYCLFPSGTGVLPVTLGALWTVALVLGAQAASGVSDFLMISGVILAAGSFTGLLWLLAFYSGGRYLTAIGYMLGGPLFAGFLLAHTIVLRDIGESSNAGRDWLFLALLVIFANDTGAYLVGRTLGRHRMAPNISPGKTWEGAGGGLVWAVAAAVVLGSLLDVSPLRWQLAVIGATVGMLSQCGDIFGSKLKRVSNVKDSGNIIPGHGGVLDRLDSIVVSVPAVYYLLVTVFEP